MIIKGFINDFYIESINKSFNDYMIIKGFINDLYIKIINESFNDYMIFLKNF